MIPNRKAGSALAIIFMALAFPTIAQQTVAIGDSNPKTNAILYLKGNGSQGLIIPIVSSLGNFGEAGMVVYNSTDKRIHYHDGNSWTVVGGSAASTDLIIGNEVSAVGNNGALVLGGSGTNASPLTVSLISGTANGQILKWNNAASRWELGTDNTGSSALNNGQILIGNASNVSTPVTVSGDATLTNAGVLTLVANAINSAKIADGSIVNADIAGNAAIAPSKIAQASATDGQVLKWNGSQWAPASDNSGSINLNAGQVLIGNASNVPAATTLSGDATLSSGGAITLAMGSVNSAKIQDGTITNADIATTAAISPGKLAQGGASNGQVLKWNGTAWTAAADNTGSVALNSGQILLGDATNVATATTISGDATISNTGVLTVGTNAINSGKIADGSVSSADIANGTITNTDVAAAAAIDGSKVNPNFAAQNITTTGSVSGAALNASGTVTLTSLAGAGTRMVVADAAGLLSTQAVSGTFSTSNVIPKGNGTTLVSSLLYDDGTNVGIGTSSPGYLLDLQKTLTSGSDAQLRLYNPSITDGDKAGLRLGTGSGWAVHLNTVTNGDWLQLTNNAGTAAHRWTYRQFYPGAGSAYIEGTGLDMALMGGFIGVGTLTPDRKLDISDSYYKLLRLNSTSAGAGIELVSSSNNDWLLTTWNNQFYLTQSTDDFATQSDQFIFSGTYFMPASDNSKNLGSLSNRWTALYSVNGTIQTSDARLKQNITNLHYGLEEVLALRPVSFRWKNDATGKKLGLIAQEVQSIVPEIVTSAEGSYLGMNYSELVPVLIKAIQEQQETIERLSREVQSMNTKQNEIDGLRAEVEAIKAALGMRADNTQR